MPRDPVATPPGPFELAAILAQRPTTPAEPVLALVTALGLPQGVKCDVSDGTYPRGYVLIRDVVPLQRQVGDSDDGGQRRPETVLMSLGMVVRHRNSSDAQSTGLHNGPNGLTRNVPRNRWLLEAQPDLNLIAVSGWSLRRSARGMRSFWGRSGEVRGQLHDKGPGRLPRYFDGVAAAWRGPFLLGEGVARWCRDEEQVPLVSVLILSGRRRG